MSRLGSVITWWLSIQSEDGLEIYLAFHTGDTVTLCGPIWHVISRSGDWWSDFHKLLYSLYCTCVVPVVATHWRHRVGKVLESKAIRGEQPWWTSGDRLADSDVQRTWRGDRLWTTTHQRLLPGKPWTRRVSLRHTGWPSTTWLFITVTFIRHNIEQSLVEIQSFYKAPSGSYEARTHQFSSQPRHTRSNVVSTTPGRLRLPAMQVGLYITAGWTRNHKPETGSEQAITGTVVSCHQHKTIIAPSDLSRN